MSQKKYYQRKQGKSELCWQKPLEERQNTVGLQVTVPNQPAGMNSQYPAESMACVKKAEATDSFDETRA